MEQSTDAVAPSAPCPRVVVAEDAGVQVRLMRMCLERAACEVLAARDGAEALRLIAVEIPDLVILDVDMPGLNGFQVLERLRKNPDTDKIPVIMLTAHAKDSGLFQEWATENDLFMTKPFSSLDLIANVQHVLSLTSDSSCNKVGVDS